MRESDQYGEPPARPYPEAYLHVTECRTGNDWILPLRGNSSLDIKTQVRKWIKREYPDSGLRLHGWMSKLEGDYYAKLITDGRSPDTVVVWDSGGFWLTDEPTITAAWNAQGRWRNH